MNLYLVVSELLTDIVWEDKFNNVGHEESYCIAELVIARNRGQAKWLAWKADESFTDDPLEMPKMSCHKQATLPDVTTPSIVTRNPEYQFGWGDDDMDDGTEEIERILNLDAAASVYDAQL